MPAPASPDRLPGQIPLFPLQGVILLPRSGLPLNVFEPRYLAMTDRALAGARLIGMVQPREGSGPQDPEPPLYDVGGAGLLRRFAETDDGRYLVELRGVARFRLRAAALADGGFRVADADWSEFANDLRPDPGAIDREAVLDALRRYCEARALSPDWKSLGRASDEQLVNVIACSCGFRASELQGLLEAPGLSERAEVLLSLLAMAEAGEPLGSERSIN